MSDPNDPYAGTKPMPRAEDLEAKITVEEARRIIEEDEAKSAPELPKPIEIAQNRLSQKDQLRFHWRWVIAQEVSKICQHQFMTPDAAKDLMQKMWDFISEGKFEK